MTWYPAPPGPTGIVFDPGVVVSDGVVLLELLGVEAIDVLSLRPLICDSNVLPAWEDLLTVDEITEISWN